MTRRRTRTRRLPTRRLLALAGLLLVAYLYYHPLRAYLDARREQAARAADVRALEARKRALERQLQLAGSPAVLAREARMELSLVKPGERLYIVKGIDAWRRAQRRAR